VSVRLTAPEATPQYRQVLDDLILLAFERYADSDDNSVKIGDLVRMIELRHKITPEGADQKQFWSELDKLRKKALRTPPSKRTRTTAGNTKKRTRTGA